MKIKFVILVAAVLAQVAAMPAYADVTITFRTTATFPKVHEAAGHISTHGWSAKDQQRISLECTSINKVYISGLKMRSQSKILNMETRMEYSLGTSDRTYGVYKNASPYFALRMLNTAGPWKRLADTGNTAIVLGHLCREYTATFTTNSSAMVDISGPTHVTVFAAPDLPVDPRLVSLTFSNPVLKGIPLKTISVFSSDNAKWNGMAIVTYAIKISTAPIPASEFQVPFGYRLIYDWNNVFGTAVQPF